MKAGALEGVANAVTITCGQRAIVLVVSIVLCSYTLFLLVAFPNVIQATCRDSYPFSPATHSTIDDMMTATMMISMMVLLYPPSLPHDCALVLLPSPPPPVPLPPVPLPPGHRTTPLQAEGHDEE